VWRRKSSPQRNWRELSAFSFQFGFSEAGGFGGGELIADSQELEAVFKGFGRKGWQGVRKSGASETSGLVRRLGKKNFNRILNGEEHGGYRTVERADC
jgi:hypothetical protein